VKPQPHWYKTITSKHGSTHSQHITLNIEKQSNQPTPSLFTEIRRNPKCNKGGNLLRIAPCHASELNLTP